MGQVLAESYKNKVSFNNEAEIHLDSIPGKSFRGRVETISLKADESTRTFHVEIVVSNGDGEILPGMVARVKIKSEKIKKTVVVPSEAVETVNGVQTVQIMKNGKVEQRIVVTEIQKTGSVIVIKGLSEGDNLIIPKSKEAIVDTLSTLD